MRTPSRRSNGRSSSRRGWWSCATTTTWGRSAASARSCATEGMRSARERLVAELRRHVADERVLEAIRTVPRDVFVPPDLRREAWDNIPLPIGSGQTISQPLVVARMCEVLELRGDEAVLDVGTGSGYHAAILARLAAEVYSIELHAELSERAARALEAAGAAVTLAVGDGSLGLPAHAPYDAINVAAAAQLRVP